jgi:hypothetical protein
VAGVPIASNQIKKKQKKKYSVAGLNSEPGTCKIQERMKGEDDLLRR